MVVFASRLAAFLCALAAPVAGQEAAAPPNPSAVAPSASEPAQTGGERRCAGEVCIRADTYAQDVCHVIEEAAEAEGLDVGFFARLLWRESLFDANAVSHAGAQGIAQFMPGTARLRGLRDPFNPAEAILASADYLSNLERRFGSLGMAAAAYNAGELRAERYLAGTGGLPGETRAYVAAITGLSAAAWRDGTLGTGPRPAPDLSLDPGLPFGESCLARAVSRTMPSFAPEAVPEPELLPWGVVLAALGSREAAERRAGEMADRFDTVLTGERIDHVRTRVPGRADRRHVAQVGRDTREAAEALCARLRAAGGICMVLRNQ